MQRRFHPLATSIIRGTIASWLCAALLSALALSVSPSWHEKIHSDAKSAKHECAVTLVSSGKYQHVTTAPLVAAPIPALHFRFIPAMHPIWVASPFLSARIFEHAPPAHA